MRAAVRARGGDPDRFFPNPDKSGERTMREIRKRIMNPQPPDPGYRERFERYYAEERGDDGQS